MATVSKVMNRCSWCNHFLWLYQRKSPGGTMHQRCDRLVNQILRRDAWIQSLELCRVCNVMPTANRNLICNTCAANAAIRARQEERL